MILMNTKDIIDKARQLADLQNSDYISYSENLTLLNDAYAKLYQKCINASDKIYLKKMELTPSTCGEYDNAVAYELPCDFYQIYSVRGGNGYYSHPILRKPKDEVGVTSGYDIINNQLVLYGFSDASVQVEYFPVPDTLYIANESLELGSYEGTPLAYSENTLITLQGTTVIAYDLTTSYEINRWSLEGEVVGLPIAISNAIAGVNQVIIHFTRGEEHLILEAEYNSKGSIATDDGTGIIIRDVSDNSIFLEKATEHFNALAGIIDEEENMSYYIKEEKENKWLLCMSEGKELYREELPGATDEIKMDYFFDDKIYIIDENKLYTFNVDDRCLEEVKKNRSDKFISVGKIDLKTGYGYLINKSGRGYYITSCFKNTELDYPNNFYFNFLSYMLAISYKSKQGADFSALMAVVTEAEEQYYDSFKRDVNNCTRINNVVY